MIKRIKLLSLAILALLSISTTSCFNRIDAGNVGIKVNQMGDEKGVSKTVFVTGYAWYNPLTEAIYEFPTFVQHKEYDAFQVQSKDGSSFEVAPSINYMIKSDSVPSFFKKFRKELPDVENGYLKNEVFDAYRIATNTFKADSLISNRNDYENKVKTLLTERITRQGYILSQLSTSLNPPKSLKEAIESKNTAVQKAIQAENQVRTAEANSKIQIVEATAAAKSVEIAATAEANANRLKQSTLTPMLIQQQWIEQWDGKLPTYMLGDKTSMMMNIK